MFAVSIDEPAMQAVRNETRADRVQAMSLNDESAPHCLTSIVQPCGSAAWASPCDPHLISACCYSCHERQELPGDLGGLTTPGGA
jgi:hypothetical protein